VSSASPSYAPARASLKEFAKENGAILALVAFCIVASIASGGVFLRPSNIATVLYQASIIGVLALGQMIVIIVGGIDLSVVTALILSATIMGGAGSEQQATMMLSGTLPYIGFWPALLAGFVVAILAGCLNGVAITRLKIPAFIATLSMSLLMGGLVLLLTGGTPIYYPDPFYAWFGQLSFLGLAASTYIPIVLSAICVWALNRTAFGKKLYAVGSSESAALHSGVPIARVRWRHTSSARSLPASRVSCSSAARARSPTPPDRPCC